MKVSDKPSIFSDRSGIGSSEELDEYGVWVKSEPEDMPGSAGDEECFFDEPAALSSADSLPDDGGFDIDFLPDVSAQTSEEASPFDFEDETSSATDAVAGEDELSSADFAPDGSELAMEEVESPAPAADEINTDAFDFNGFLEAESGSSAQDDSGAELDENIFEVSEENAALPVEDAGAALAETEFSDDDPFALDIAPDETAGIAPVSLDSSDINLTIDDVVTGELSAGPEADISFDTEELAEEPPFPAEEEMPSETEAFSAVESASKPEPQTASDQNNLPTELLLKIANELSTIKTELDDLKSEISDLKSAAHRKMLPMIDEEVTLTGKELNDVINSAEVTSETDVLPETANMPLNMFLEESALDAEPMPETALDDGSVAQFSDTSADISSMDDENISLTTDELNGLDDVDESISLSESELSNLDDVDESISLSESELGNLDEIDEAISLPVIELNQFENLDNQTSDNVGEIDSQAVNEVAAGADNIDESGFDTEAGLEDNAPDAPEDGTLDIDLQLDEVPTADGETSFDEASGFIPSEETLELDMPVSENEIEETNVPPDAEPMVVTAAPVEEAPETEQSVAEPHAPVETVDKMTEKLKNEIRTVLAYMDQLLESLPEEKIEEFARSDKFDVYKKVFKDLGLV